MHDKFFLDDIADEDLPTSTAQIPAVALKDLLDALEKFLDNVKQV